jgi:DNA repair exonuclease SbcCD ATPase subunit
MLSQSTEPWKLQQNLLSSPATLSQKEKVDVLASVIIDVVEKSLATSLLRKRGEELQELAEQAALMDEKNRKNFRDHHALIEQGAEAKRRAQAKAAAMKEKLDLSIEPRRESALKAATQILSMIEESSQDQPDHTKQLKDHAEQLEKLCQQTASLPREVLQAREAAQISVNPLHQRLLKIEVENQNLSRIRENFNSFSEKSNRRLGLLEQRQKQENSEAYSLVNRRLSVLEQCRKQEHAEELSNLKTRMNLVEELSSLKTRMNLVEQRQKQETLVSIENSNQTTVSRVAFEELENMVKSLFQKQEELESRSEAQRQELADLKRSTKVAPIPVPLPESPSNSVSKSLMETTNQDLEHMRQQIQAMDRARLSDFESVAADMQKSQSAIDQLQSEFKANNIANTARDEVVIEQVESLEGRLKKVETTTGDLSRGLGNHIGATKKAVDDLNDYYGRELRRLAEQNKSNRPIQVEAIDPQIAADISTLKTRLSGVDAELKSLQAIGHSNDYSLRLLNSRFNNLTTEQITRAMVHQLTEMYPYASTAQAEFIKVREDRAAFQKLRQDYISASLQIVKNAASIDSQLQRVDALEKRGLQGDAKVDGILDQLKEGRAALESRVGDYNMASEERAEQQKQFNTKITDQVAKIRQDLDECRSSLGASTVELNNKLNLAETAHLSLPKRSASIIENKATPSHQTPTTGAANDSLKSTLPSMRAGEADELHYLREWLPDLTSASSLNAGQSFDQGSDISETPSGADAVKSHGLTSMSKGSKRKRNMENDRSDEEDYIECKSSKAKLSRRQKASRKA